MPVLAAPIAKQEVPGRVAFLEGNGDLPMIEVTTPTSTAEIYLHGAHVTHFQKRGEPPLLFMSRCSRFESEQPIRGGVPIIFPWFGPREGLAQHGFARNKTWELKEVLSAADGSTSLRFQLPDCPEASAFPPFTAEYTITVGDVLTMRLDVTNDSPDESLLFENCLHTYLEVEDITAVTVRGLEGVRYLDKTDSYAAKTEADANIRISSEVDRTYLDTTGVVQVLDSRLGRRILVEKSGSNSTVLWNPWTERARQIPDFGDEEYTQMLCVESGNVATNQLKLGPGRTSRLEVTLRTESLG